jgi:hypothetical protein
MAIALVIVSCKKGEVDISSLNGKWTVDSIQLGGYTNTANEYFWTIYKNNGENYYYDFREGNDLYIYFNGRYDTIPNYTIATAPSGKRYISYPPYTGDTIHSLSKTRLILISRQGGKSLVYFSK